ncbi:cell wall metabolism sensor histidine kinase WalK [Kribbella sp. VKM Ac-2568]|uniref:sensor histidine kinase n=1 Tax=Kribbella sp. VKM Ac-2568 TaxID=2512219 RepID=UPI001053D26C|nr:HAMP domain-containing sensor histidine kinase [Kribbella sp. VKM Ac-2568]TCM51670.1 two-component system OmpR family sensor kinase [Kribbella sp. VKM Ac-2568]
MLGRVVRRLQLRWWFPTSLTARVAAAVVLLVAVVSVLISGLTTAAISSYLTRQLDTKVAASHGRAVGALTKGVAQQSKPPPDIENAHGQDAGTVTVYRTDLGANGNVITADGELNPLSEQALGVLGTIPAAAESETVELPGLGQYRIQASRLGDTLIVTGLPTKEVDDTLASLLVWEASLSTLGVLAAGGVAVLVVRRQLRPLRDVAQTAREVSGIPLAAGEIGMTARVPEHLTDERTEVGQVAVALNTLLGHMEEALDARHRSELQVRQFVADASHELRTPLTTIHGYAELSLRRPDPEQLTHAMGKVLVEATRMTSLVEDLLLLARLDAGRPLERRPVDLTRLAMESVADAMIVGPDHRWALRLPEDPVMVDGDEQRLHQVVSNLLTNARRHTPPGTTVTVTLSADDSHLAVLTIHDNGPGIPETLQRTVFKRFSRSDISRTRDSGGSGLGLSLAQSITEAHGGALTVTSRSGNTSFTLALPRTRPPASSSDRHFLPEMDTAPGLSSP